MDHKAMIVESGPSNWGGQLILDGFSGEREPALGDARSESNQSRARAVSVLEENPKCITIHDQVTQWFFWMQ